jgi:DNA-directed RNA polymerase alpha subunit
MSETPGDILDRPPSDLWAAPSRLATLIANTLKRADIYTTGELVQWSAEDLRRIRGLGETSLDEVRRILATHGLSLAGESS